jgi:hypothetical protein
MARKALAFAGLAGLAFAQTGSLVVIEEGTDGRPISAILSSFDASVDTTKLSCALAVQRSDDSKYYSVPYPGTTAAVQSAGSTSFCRFEAWDYAGASNVTSLYLYVLKEGIEPIDVLGSADAPSYTVDQSLAAVYHKVGLAAPAAIAWTEFPENNNATVTPISGYVPSLDSATARIAQAFGTVSGTVAGGATKALLFFGRVDTSVAIGVATGGSGVPVVGDDGFVWTALGNPAAVDSSGRFSFPLWSIDAMSDGSDIQTISAFKVLIVPAALPDTTPLWMAQALAAGTGVSGLGSTSVSASDGSADSNSGLSHGLHPGIIVIIVAGAVLAIAGLAGLAFISSKHKEDKQLQQQTKKPQAEAQRPVAQDDRQQEQRPRSSVKGARKKRQQQQQREQQEAAVELAAVDGTSKGKKAGAGIAVVTKGNTPQAVSTEDGNEETASNLAAEEEHHDGAGLAIDRRAGKNASQTSFTAGGSEYLHLGSTSVSASSAAARDPSEGSALHDHSSQPSGGIAFPPDSERGGVRVASTSSLSFMEVQAIATPDAVKQDGVVAVVHNKEDGTEHDHEVEGEEEQEQGDDTLAAAPGAIVTPVKNDRHHKKAAAGVAATLPAVVAPPAGLGIQRRGITASAAPGHQQHQQHLVAPAASHSSTSTVAVAAKPPVHSNVATKKGKQ